MELSHAAGIGQQGTAASGSSIAATLSAGAAVGEVVVVRVGSANQTEVGGAGNTNFHQSLADTKGNTWTKLYEWSREQVPFEVGVTISMWYTKVTVSMEASDVVTGTFDGAEPYRILTVDRYTTEQPIASIDVVAANGNGGIHTSTPTTLSVTTDALAIEEWEWFGAGYHNSNALFGLGLTLDANWVTDRAIFPIPSDAACLWGQKRTLAIDELTWDIAKTTGSGRWALVLVALRVTPEDPPPSAAGTREFQSDFNTAGHVVSGTSIDRRIDAISRDYTVGKCLGPVAIDDDSEGIEAYRWEVRADGADIYLRRSNLANTAWGDWVLFDTIAGSVPVSEIDIAFTLDAALVLAAEVPSGSGGAPNLTLYRMTGWVAGPAGTSPRLINDIFPAIETAPHICPPQRDVQLFYMKTGVGLKRREEADNFTVDYDTPLGWSANRRVEEAFKTDDRRVGVVASRRDPSTGRYVKEEIYSTQYTDALLFRPTFLPWSSPSLDLFQQGETAWYSPELSTETNTWNLRVGTTDACDAIEVGASLLIPNGVEPPFDEQEQTATNAGVGFGAGGFADFTFSITHGNGTMSLMGFRARIRRTIGEVTCYSPWRYMLIPAANLKPTPDDQSVNCDRDAMLDVPYRMDWPSTGLVEGIRNTDVAAGPDTVPFPCEDFPALTAADTGIGQSHAGWFFVGGQRNTSPSFPFPTHFVPYSIRRRPFTNYNFIDEDGVHHVGSTIGTAVNGSGGSTPIQIFTWPSSRFPTQFPELNGLPPVIPFSGDIVDRNDLILGMA